MNINLLKPLPYHQYCNLWLIDKFTEYFRPKYLYQSDLKLSLIYKGSETFFSTTITNLKINSELKTNLWTFFVINLEKRNKKGFEQIQSLG